MSDVQPAPAEGAEAADGGSASFEDLDQTYEQLEQTEGLAPDVVTQIGKLRKEHARYKERFRPYEQTFSGLHPDDARVLMYAAQQLAAGEVESVAKIFFEASKGLAGDTFNEWITPAEQQEINEVAEEAVAQGFNPEDIDAVVEKKLAEFAAKQAEEREAEALRQEIVGTLKDLGYSDPDNPKAQMVLFRAKQLGGTDLRADLTSAHEWVQESLAEEAKNYISQKTADAGEPIVPVGDPASGTQLSDDLSFDDKIKALVSGALSAENDPLS